MMKTTTMSNTSGTYLCRLQSIFVYILLELGGNRCCLFQQLLKDGFLVSYVNRFSLKKVSFLPLFINCCLLDCKVACSKLFPLCSKKNKKNLLAKLSPALSVT
ncbi:hypothetical protein L1987_32842 [Smallanthus sonchifolius]|uniref:Uncharacterized protein n=1 Tax=Smallanthus sonchifolius TaxID=185202 RepID=A0ACB9HQK2_9ASTR|nr:hypothetical protein L1987_32842 [Smallanthus sonchifolius]